MKDYRVTTSYFCCVVSVNKNIVVKAAPIMGWSVGRSIRFVEKWVLNKKGTIEELCEVQKKCSPSEEEN